MGKKDKESKAKEYKHMTFYEAAELAKNADVKEMWLTHYSPSLIRPADYVGNIKNIFKNVDEYSFNSFSKSFFKRVSFI